MIKYIVLTGGFAESNTISQIIFGLNFLGETPGFETEEQALASLACDLYHKYYYDYLDLYQWRYSAPIKECCLKTLSSFRQGLRWVEEEHVCHTCHSKLEDKKFVGYEFSEYILKLFSAVTDTYGDAEDVPGHKLVWSPFWTEGIWGTPREEILVIEENGEHELLEALLEIKPELKPLPEDEQYFYFGTKS